MEKKQLTRREKHLRAQRRKRKRLLRYAYISLSAVFALSIALALALSSNAVPSDQQQAEASRSVEILAPAAAINKDPEELAAREPETQAPTAVPTPTPIPTPEPTEEPKAVSITITAAGDCTLGGDVKGIGYKRFRDAVAHNGTDFFLANVKEIFEQDDITIVNLEGPLTTSTNMRSNRTFNFKGDPENVDILTSASVEVCNVANNHSQDFGKEGLMETADVLEAAGIGVSGYSVIDYEEVRGVTIGFVGLTEWDYKESEIRSIISEAREACDLLVVSMHWGEESSYTTTSLQRKLGHACVEAGADLVLGAHSHVIGEIEKYNDKYIIYSLGNFCFGGNGNPSDKDTMIFQQSFDITPEGNVEDGGITVIPCSISSVSNSNNFQPTPLTSEAAQTLMKKIAKYSSLDLYELSN